MCVAGDFLDTISRFDCAWLFGLLASRRCGHLALFHSTQPRTLCFQGPYVLIALGGGAVNSTSIFAPMWIEYAKADARWGVRDATVISLGAALLAACRTLLSVHF